MERYLIVAAVTGFLKPFDQLNLAVLQGCFSRFVLSSVWNSGDYSQKTFDRGWINVTFRLDSQVKSCIRCLRLN